MADDLADAESDIAEQSRWGLTLSDRSLLKAVRVIRALATRLKALEDRVTTLENKTP